MQAKKASERGSRLIPVDGDPQERENPEVFFQPGPSGRKALARWATAARKTEQDMIS